MTLKTNSNTLYTLGEDKARVAHSSWYRGEECNFLASKKNLAEEAALDNYILKGWMPTAPFIHRQNQITTFGSCFAQHISQFLTKQGYLTGFQLARRLHKSWLNIYNSHIIRFGEGMVNTFALRQQFEWAYTGKSFGEHLWHNSKGQIVEYLDEIRVITKEIFDQTDVFIITLGLSEVWHNKITGEVFWRSVPREHFDPQVHGFKVSSFKENYENLESILTLIRQHRPRASVIFTLSPVPLIATFRSISCISANSVSKSILRTALDELIRNHPEDHQLFYWPAYEMIKEFYHDPYEEDNRHIKKKVVSEIMETFKHYYLQDALSNKEYNKRKQEIIHTLMSTGNVTKNKAEEMFHWGVQTTEDMGEYEQFRKHMNHLTLK